MKKSFIYAIVLALFTFTSCEKLNVETIDKDGFVDLTFNVQSVESAYKTRATLADVKAKKLDFAIYSCRNSKYTLFEIVQQESTDENFGSISLTKVPYGSYKIIALAHLSSAHASMTDFSKIEFEGKPTETFSAVQDITLNAESANSYSLKMTRVTSRFTLIAADAQPANVASAEFTFTGAATNFNASTGFASAADENSRTTRVDLTNSAYVKNKNFYVHMFLPSNDTKINVVVKFFDSKDNVLITKEFKDVAMQQNRNTICKGDVYSSLSSTQGFSFSIDDTWKEDLVVPF